MDGRLLESEQEDQVRELRAHRKDGQEARESYFGLAWQVRHRGTIRLAMTVAAYGLLAALALLIVHNWL